MDFNACSRRLEVKPTDETRLFSRISLAVRDSSSALLHLVIRCCKSSAQYSSCHAHPLKSTRFHFVEANLRRSLLVLGLVFILGYLLVSLGELRIISSQRGEAPVHSPPNAPVNSINSSSRLAELLVPLMNLSEPPEDTSAKPWKARTTKSLQELSSCLRKADCRPNQTKGELPVRSPAAVPNQSCQ